MRKPPVWNVAIGCDDAGYEYKEILKADLADDPRVCQVVDLGVKTADDTRPYSSVGLDGASKVASGQVDRCVLICGTGIGMAVAANKVRGVRATVVHDSYSCERSVLSNDCQVITLGQRVIGTELARRLVREWLGYVFDSTGSSQHKVEIIESYEKHQATTSTRAGETYESGERTMVGQRNAPGDTAS